MSAIVTSSRRRTAARARASLVLAAFVLAVPAAGAAGAAGTTTYVPAGAATASPTTTAPATTAGAAPTSVPAATVPAATVPAATPTTAPGVATTAPAATATQAPASASKASKGDRPLSTGAIVIAVLAALLILACIGWALARRRAFEPHWLLSLRHAAAEAGFRASATWSEFLDWVRLGH
jgi:hypothetical protein